MGRRENPPIFKVGQLVCFQLSEKKEPWKQCWHLGEIISFPMGKNNNEVFVEIRPYEIPESFRLRESAEEWSCLDPLQIDFTRDMIILNLLSGQTRVAMQAGGKVIQVSITDLCPATYSRFQRALTIGKVFSLNGKQSFW